MEFILLIQHNDSTLWTQTKAADFHLHQAIIPHHNTTSIQHSSSSNSDVILLIYVLIGYVLFILVATLFRGGKQREHGTVSETTQLPTPSKQRLGINTLSVSNFKPNGIVNDLQPSSSQQNVGRVQDSTSYSPCFFFEAFASSGPRKSLNDYEASRHEVCEDSVGVSFKITESERHYVWWICDGTSQDPVLLSRISAGLSSRLLSRDIGASFGEIILAGGYYDGRNLRSLLHSKLVEIWTKRFNSFLQSLEEVGRLSDINRLGVTTTGVYVLRWSSTLLGGSLTQGNDGTNELTLFQAGDSGAFVAFQAGEKKCATPILPVATRIVLSIEVDCLQPRNFCVRVSFPDNVMSPFRFRNVFGFAALSDGVVKTDFDRFLNNLCIKCAIEPFHAIRDGLVRRADSTYDDKSMIVGWTLGD